MNLTFTLATIADAAAICNLRNKAAEHLTILFGHGHWSYHVSEKGVISGMKGNSWVFVARDGNGIAGTLRFASKKPWAIDTAYFTKAALPYYLLDMAVLPELQRKGIGTFMIREAVAHAKATQAGAIRLDAYDHAAGAGEFYRKCGFEERARVVYRATPLIYFEYLL